MVPLGTLGTFLGLRTSTKMFLFGDLFLDRILHRFWAPLGGGRHAIRVCICIYRKGRPFSKRYHFEVNWDLILESKRAPKSPLYSFLLGSRSIQGSKKGIIFMLEKRVEKRGCKTCEKSKLGGSLQRSNPNEGKVWFQIFYPKEGISISDAQ